MDPHDYQHEMKIINWNEVSHQNVHPLLSEGLSTYSFWPNSPLFFPFTETKMLFIYTIPPFNVNVIVRQKKTKTIASKNLHPPLTLSVSFNSYTRILLNLITRAIVYFHHPPPVNRGEARGSLGRAQLGGGGQTAERKSSSCLRSV